MGDIVQMTVYFVNMERDLDKTIPIWQKYMPSDNRSAAAWIGITELVPMEPPVLVEITCSAIIPDE